MFVYGKHFEPSLGFVDKARAYSSFAIRRLGTKSLPETTNTAYFVGTTATKKAKVLLH
jgi:hypothetical protein